VSLLVFKTRRRGWLRLTCLPPPLLPSLSAVDFVSRLFLTSSFTFFMNLFLLFPVHPHRHIMPLFHIVPYCFSFSLSLSYTVALVKPSLRTAFGFHLLLSDVESRRVSPRITVAFLTPPPPSAYRYLSPNYRLFFFVVVFSRTHCSLMLDIDWCWIVFDNIKLMRDGGESNQDAVSPYFHSAEASLL